MERRNFLTTGLVAGLAIAIPYSGVAGHLKSNNDKNPLMPFYIPPGEKLSLSPQGINFRILVHSNQTNNQFSCYEALLDKKTMGPPPHVHKELDELMFVQEGTMTALVGDEICEVKAGGWHLRPHGIIHTFWNGTDHPARYIDMYFNQNFDDFMEERFLKLVPGFIEKGISLDSTEAIEKFIELDERFGIIEYFDRRKPLMEKYGLKN